MVTSRDILRTCGVY